MSEKEELNFNIGDEAEDVELESVEFEPKQNGEWLDFTDLPLNQIYLVNKNDILETPKTSWIPDIYDTDSKFHPFIPTAVKDDDGNYRIYDKDENNKERLYIVTPDLLAITADYYKKKKDAQLKRDYQKRFSECKEKIVEVLKKAFPDEETFKNYNENDSVKISIDNEIQNLCSEIKVEGISNIFEYNNPFNHLIKYHLMKNSTSEKNKSALEYLDFSNEECFNKKFKKAFEKNNFFGFGKVPSARWHTSKRTMSGVRFRRMSDLCKNHLTEKSRNQIFKELENERTDIAQKILDLNYQKIDYLGRFVKGRETSYGESNLNDSLKEDFGVMVKRQDGTEFTKKQMENMRELLTKMYSHYGNLSKEFTESGYKISYAADVNQHASKSAIGIYFPFYKAIGVSVFNDDLKDASCVFSHEIAHYLDGKRGNELKRYFASDDENSLEYKIADTFRKHINNKELKGYWKRTCECFARALEQYYSVEKSIYTTPENPQNNPYFEYDAYCSFESYNKYIKPLVQEYMKEHAKRFGFEEIENEKGKLMEIKEIDLEDKLKNFPPKYNQERNSYNLDEKIIESLGIVTKQGFQYEVVNNALTGFSVFEYFEDNPNNYHRVEIDKEKNSLLNSIKDFIQKNEQEKNMEENEKIPLGEAIEQTLFEMGAVPESQRSKSYDERLRDGELTETEKEVRRNEAKSKLSNLMEQEREYVKEHTPANYSYNPNAYFYDESVFENFSKIVNDEIDKNNDEVISKVLNFSNSVNEEYEYTEFGNHFAKQLLHDIDRKNYFEYLSEVEKTNETEKNPTISKFLEIIKSDKYGEDSYQHPEMGLDFIKDTVELIKNGKSTEKNEDGNSIESLINSFEISPEDKNNNYHWSLNNLHYKIYPFVEEYEKSKTVKTLREFYKELGENNGYKYEPFVFNVGSESSIFKESHYSLRDFNEIISREDKRKHDLKNKFYEKYGRGADFYELRDSGKLDEEFKNYEPGYDKTNFVICIPKGEDNLIYTPTRYDISDGEGTVFDFVRKTCSYPEIINEMDKVENELYYPENSVNYLQKDMVRRAVNDARELYHFQLEENLKQGIALKNSTYVRLWEDIGYKKNVDPRVQKILDNSKESFEQFTRTVVGKLGENWIHPLSENVPSEIDNPKMTGLMTVDAIQEFIAKEIRKAYIEEMYHNDFSWDDVKRSINNTVDVIHIEDLVKDNVKQYIWLREEGQQYKINQYHQTEEYKQQQIEAEKQLDKAIFEDASNKISKFVTAEFDRKKDKILSEEKISQMDLGELQKKLFARTNDEEYEGMAEAIVEHLNTHRAGIISGETTLESLAEETVKNYINSINKKNLKNEWEKRARLEVVDSNENSLPKMTSKSSKWLTVEDVKLLNSWGYKDFDEITQMQEAILVSSYELNDKKTTVNKVIESLGRTEFLSGISRSAFHWSAARENNGNSVYFDSSLLFAEGKEYAVNREKLEKARREAKEHINNLKDILTKENDLKQNSDSKDFDFKKKLSDFVNSKDFENKTVSELKEKIDAIFESFSRESTEKTNTNEQRVEVKIVFDKSSGKANLKFKDKPDEKIRDELRKSNWLWSSLNGVWWPKSKDKDECLKFAKNFVEKYGLETQNEVEEKVPSEKERTITSFKTQMNDLLYQGMSFDNSFKAVFDANNTAFSEIIKSELNEKNLRTQEQILNFITDSKVQKQIQNPQIKAETKTEEVKVPKTRAEYGGLGK